MTSAAGCGCECGARPYRGGQRGAGGGSHRHGGEERWLGRHRGPPPRAGQVLQHAQEASGARDSVSGEAAGVAPRGEEQGQQVLCVDHERAVWTYTRLPDTQPA